MKNILRFSTFISFGIKQTADKSRNEIYVSREIAAKIMIFFAKPEVILKVLTFSREMQNCLQFMVGIFDSSFRLSPHFSRNKLRFEKYVDDDMFSCVWKFVQWIRLWKVSKTGHILFLLRASFNSIGSFA